MNELRSAIEAVLFVAEKPVTVGELVRATGARPREVEQALAALEELRGSSGLRLQRDGDAWRLVTSPESARAVTAYLGADRLRISHAALETLSVIACGSRWPFCQNHAYSCVSGLPGVAALPA